jgi:hypothetical protein
MDISHPRGKVVDFPSPSIRSSATLAAYRISQDLLRPRLRRDILPPTIIGSPPDAGDSLLWLTNNDRVGFMLGVALSADSGYVRGFFQDGEVLLFSDKERSRIQNHLFVLPEGINFFRGDRVYVEVHTSTELGTINHILSYTRDTAEIQLDSGETILQPFRNMVLSGPDLHVPDISAYSNI